ncbi:MAG: replication-associated recombination protein A, partial [Spirochaetota bacterium]
RARVLKLNPLSEVDLAVILDRVMKEDPHLSLYTVAEDARSLIIGASGGDARKMLNLIESMAAQSTESDISAESVSREIEHSHHYYDRSGERHYDTISAFIKSVRGSDPDAAVYYLARMISGGEDPLFIARRLVILASEDVGNASPQALSIAVSAMEACRQIGMPEARIILSQCAIFLACSPKSNASYMAINRALEDVQHDSAEIPMHIRNAPTELMEKMGYAEGYTYPHDCPSSFSGQDYFPKGRECTYYTPTENGSEKAIRARLRELWPQRHPSPDEKNDA